MTKIAVFVQDQYRLDDHPALSAAIAIADPSVFAFTVRNDHRDFDPESNHPICGPFRRQFQDQAIQELASNLEKIGIPLMILEHSPSDEEIVQVLKRQGVQTIFCSDEQLQKNLWLKDTAKHQITTRFFAGNHLFSDWPMHQDQFPKVFTDFKKKLQRSPDPCATAWFPSTSTSSKSELHPFPQHGAQDSRTAIPFDGGEPSALARLNHYFLKTDRLSRYKETRNGLIGTEYSSKLSPFLATGSISSRRIWNLIDLHDARFGKNEGSEWMRYELLWREFFYWQSLKYPEQFFTATGIQNKNQTCTPDLAKLESWIQGQTGDAFVDACMIELSTTGYLSNRGRQNAASYLVHTLQLPWLWGARYFEWVLIDFDRTQNYGNWAYLAGVGSDPRSFGNQGPRFFNTEKQAQDYDPDSAYRNLWKRSDRPS